MSVSKFKLLDPKLNATETLQYPAYDPSMDLDVRISGQALLDFILANITLVPSTGDPLFDITFTTQLSSGRTLGKYPTGSTITYVQKSLDFILKDLGIETLNPTLSNPYVSVLNTTNNGTNLTGGTYEVGTPITLQIQAAFNRGSISPAYGTSGNRSGLPSSYVFSGIKNQTISTSALSANTTNTAFNIAAGTNAINVQINHLAGEQPKNSAGGDFGSPYDAGSVNANTTIYGAYLKFFGVPTGNLGSNPIDTSSEVRGLGSTTFGNTFQIVIPAGQLNGVFAYDATLPDIVDGSVLYVEGFNAAVGNTFTKTLVNVLLPDGVTTKSYKVYTHIHTVTQATTTYNVTI